MTSTTPPTEELFENLGNALSTDYFFLREQLTDDRRRASPVGYGRRAEGHVGVFAAGNFSSARARSAVGLPVLADQGAAVAAFLATNNAHGLTS